MKNLVWTLLAGLLATPVNAEKITLNNCGFKVDIIHPPERVVSIGQGGTEILYSLGLGDKVVGTGVWFSDVLDKFKGINDKVERLADNEPSFESILNKKPQFVTSQYEWHIGQKGIIATREQFNELNIPTYILPTDCIGKDNTTEGDGTRTQLFSSKLIHKTVRELAQVFDISEKGEALVSELVARENKALETAKSLNLQDASAVFWYSSPEIKADPYVAGQKGAAGYIMKQLSLRNVINSDEEWPTVGWETIARANPSIIVIAKMQRRRFPADDFEKKLEFLGTDPVARQMEAVKKNRVIILDALDMDATIRTINALEAILTKLETFGLAQ